MQQFAKGSVPAGYSEIGTVSVSGKATLNDVEKALEAKAAELGGDAIVITAAGGDNKMFGNATVYKADA
ncbi:hypothetical protein BIZ82_gp168 [Erwinia phage vB_EamM_EarlPhillipIV]|nr:hypothetical protein BIZ82_gp168 [Erwinia phage vB_EamM_EarlPhillipIV]ANZ49017.1 hypothetical protein EARLPHILLIPIV_168 [Erwinia phage vB_EamM_EarlPhillipIV]QXO09887.1 hypothetical protein pEaSNUABM38_00165 [Erwinia phage pEa_SNUABM_38]